MLPSLAILALLAARLEFVVPDANYSLRDGLPAVQVLSLHQDRYGALWAGTTAGLAQLGGPAIRAYGADQGLARSAVFAIEEEPDGAIVVGTAGGISRLVGDRFEPVDLPAAARDLAVRRLQRTRDGILWALAGDRTLLRRSGAQWQNVGIDGALAFEAQDFTIDETGVLWLATRSHGLLRLTPSGTRFQKAAEFPAEGGLAIDHVAARGGRVYFTSARGLSMIQTEKGRPVGAVTTWPFPARDGAGHRSITVGEDGRVYVGTNSGVLSLRTGGLERLESRNDRARASTVTLLSDREGQLWVGTTEAGLHLLLLGRGVRFLRSSGESFRSIDIDRQGVHWVSNERRVLHFVTDGEGRPSSVGEARFPGFDALTVYAMAEDAAGSLLFALDGGVARVTAAARRQEAPVAEPDPRFDALRDRLVTGLHADAQGDLWAVSPLGVFRLRPGESEAQAVTLPPGSPWMAAMDDGARLWVATRQGGLLYVDVRTEGASSVALPASRHVEFLGAAPGGGVVVTFENGESSFFRADGKGGATSTPGPAGIQWLSVLSLQKMGDHYLAAHGGDQLSQIRLDPPAIEQTLLTSADLEDADFRYLTLHEGRAGQVWFTLLNGVGLLEPPNAPPPPARLRLSPGADGVILPPRPNALDVRAELSDPVAPRKARYRYRIVGESDEWSPWSEDSHVTVSNLAPGGYRLEVEAADRYGRQSEVATMSIHARAHLWESWPARLLAGLLVIGVAGAFYRRRVRGIEAERVALAAAVKAGRADLEAANQRLQELSLTDVLTGLRNRRFFNEVVEAELALLRRRYDERTSEGDPNRDAVFFLLDLDRFKTVNDIFGHAGGDAVLKETARRLASFMRRTDRLIRWGGEEFLVLSLDCRRDQAAEMAARIMSAISGEPFMIGPPGGLHITTSIGWAAYPFGVEDADPRPDEVVQIADRALYRAKRAGRNCAVGIAPAAPVEPGAAPGSTTVEMLRDLGITVSFTTIRGPVRESGQDLSTYRGTGPIRRPTDPRPS